MPWVEATIHDIFNTYLRGQAYTPRGDVYLGLATALPTLVGGFVELTSAQLGVTYARQLVTLSVPNARSCSNTVACIFATSANPPTIFTITHGGIFADATGGIPMAYGPLATGLVVGVGSLVSIPIGQLTISDAGTA